MPTSDARLAIECRILKARFGETEAARHWREQRGGSLGEAVKAVRNLPPSAPETAEKPASAAVLAAHDKLFQAHIALGRAVSTAVGDLNEAAFPVKAQKTTLAELRGKIVEIANRLLAAIAT